MSGKPALDFEAAYLLGEADRFANIYAMLREQHWDAVCLPVGFDVYAPPLPIASHRDFVPYLPDFELMDY